MSEKRLSREGARDANDARLMELCYAILMALRLSVRNNWGRKLIKNIDDITSIVVDTAFQLQSNFEPGLLESVYRALLEKKLRVSRLAVGCQKPVRIELAGIIIDEGAKETKKDRNYFLAV